MLGEEGGEAMEDSSGLPDDLEMLQIIIEETDSKVMSLQDKVFQEESKRERYKVQVLYRQDYNNHGL